jgi:hypothetical protein
MGERADDVAGLIAPPLRPWWGRRLVVALVILAAAIPLLYPPHPPQGDQLGDKGGEKVEHDHAK